MEATNTPGANGSRITNPTKPRVLFVYFTYTKQTLKVTEAMAEVLRERGCEVQLAAIELTDKRYTARFHEFPMPHPFREVLAMIPAELRRITGEIGVPDEARGGDYDLVCIGSPTWWLSTSVPVRSFLESNDAGTLLKGRPFASFVVCRRYFGHNLRTVKKLATKHGGKYVDSAHFAYEGGQIKSLFSLLSYLGTGEYRDRYLGVPIPKTNIQESHLHTARKFASGLADRLQAAKPSQEEPDLVRPVADDPPPTK
jgi:menaquinone-dependent protoporphyrinogen IX oxidase